MSISFQDVAVDVPSMPSCEGTILVPVSLPEPLKRSVADVRNVLLALGGLGVEEQGPGFVVVHNVITKSFTSDGMLNGNIGLSEGFDWGFRLDPKTMKAKSIRWSIPPENAKLDVIDDLRNRIFGLPSITQIYPQLLARVRRG